MAKRYPLRRNGRRQAASELDLLAAVVGVPPDETAWLEQALTHRSYTRERGDEERESNERLEFLGDAVAQLVVSRVLYERYPRWSEGQLTRARSAVVSREPMFRAAQRLRLGDYIKIGKTEEDGGGRNRASTLSSTFEAVIAAVYLTSGMEGAEALIHRALEEEMDAVRGSGVVTDYKSQLQEKCQAVLHRTPEYRLVQAEGPAHERSFTAEALLDGQVLGSGVGRSKKESEQAAAQKALENAVLRGENWKVGDEVRRDGD